MKDIRRKVEHLRSRTLCDVMEQVTQEGMNHVWDRVLNPAPDQVMNQALNHVWNIIIIRRNTL